MAKSIRYLTVSQQDHEIHDGATNMTLYRELENLNTKLIDTWDKTNKTFMKALQDTRSEIMTITATESSDMHRLETQVLAQKTSISSEIGTFL